MGVTSLLRLSSNLQVFPVTPIGFTGLAGWDGVLHALLRELVFDLDYGNDLLGAYIVRAYEPNIFQRGRLLVVRAHQQGSAHTLHRTIKYFPILISSIPHSHRGD